MQSVSDIIGLWPSLKDFSDDLGLHGAYHAKLMRERQSIPNPYWKAVIAGAEKRGFVVTTDTLLDAHAAKLAKSERAA